MFQNFKSHFLFTKQQRNGIFLLLTIIAILQSVYFFINLPQDDITINDEELEIYQNEIDSLKQIEFERRKPKIFPFNPNYIDDFKGSKLGMSIVEIDKLLAFRKQNKWINSSKQFQEVTGVSDSLLMQISPYFKFPKWVNSKKDNYQIKKRTNFYNTEKRDLNLATAKELQSVYGVGEKLSKRIINFRNRLEGGFVADLELTEVYGLSPEVISNIKEQFTVKTPRKIVKYNLNDATIEQLVKIKYIDYEVAYNILEYKKLHEGFTNLDELLQVKDFPKEKIEIIKLSLHI